MEICELAEQVLFGATLAEKLVRPRRLTDHRPRRDLPPVAQPTRPKELAFTARADRRIPSRESLSREDARAELLHAFANHELLAMELMALALLRFPDAPPRFRRGLAAALLEEEVHLALYRERIRALGLDLGAFPTSGFFWTALSGMESPERFVAAMSLTLEQANLDFAAEYAEIFGRLGDDATKRVLLRVLGDEIRHVRFGLRWFQRWRDPSLSLFDAHAATLTFPLTMVRAKGPRFCTDARARAGLPAEYVQKLVVFGASRGRPPDVFVFNPEAEDELAGRGPRSKAVTELVSDLAPLMLFLAKSDDLVLVPKRPSTEFLVELTEVGFTLPEIVEETPALELGRRTLGHLQPWASTKSVLSSVRARIGHSIAGTETPAALFSKAWPIERAVGTEWDVSNRRFIASAMAELESLVSRASSHGAKLVVKSEHSASGRARAWLKGPLDEKSRLFAERALSEGRVIVEEWKDGVADFGVLLHVGAKDPILGVRRFLTDPRGRYRGHILLDPLASFDAGTRAELGRMGLLEVLRRAGRWVAGELAQAGFSGFAGLDALLFRAQSGQLALEPILEINPRRTMGHVALALERRINPRAAALWLHVTKDEVTRLGHRELESWIGTVRTSPTFDKNGRINRGVLSTNDPRAKRVATVLVAAESFDSAFGVMNRT